MTGNPTLFYTWVFLFKTINPMQSLTFHPQLILRTPHEAFSLQIDEPTLRACSQTDATFREALYLASPSLFSELKSSGGLPEKILFPLTRYLIRSRYRATPFGLFSGVGVVNWGDKTRLSAEVPYSRKTRLDMDYLCALARELDRAPRLREHLVYYPNNSLYFFGGDIRYTEHFDTPVLSSVKNDLYIRAVLKQATAGADFFTLMTALRQEGISEADARAFLHELVDMQILVSELQPCITGDDFMEQILRVASRAGLPAAFTIGNVRQKLRQLDKSRSITAYEEIIHELQTLGVIPDENKLFHTVRVNHWKKEADTISTEYQEEILRVIPRLSIFAPDTHSINDFTSRFYARYEHEEVSLLTALDAESGIGYPSDEAKDFTPLTDGITLPSTEERAPERIWKEWQQALFKNLQKAQQDGAYEMPLPDIPGQNPNPGPSFAVMFRLVDDRKIFIETIGGSSAANLIGRFGHASEDISQMLHDIADTESRNNPDVIFAEIVHLPESRTGNILCRPAFRHYEIPLLARSDLPQENRISLRDLCLSVKNNRLVLRHRKLNKVVVPRLGSAHNFKNHSLPVYRFLCDLQTQGFQSSLDFTWGELAKEFVFLPRVADGRVILSPAMWQFASQHLLPVQQPDLTPDEFEAWQKQYKIPRCFVLAEGDNELFIDSANPLLLRVFLDSVKQKSAILLKEFLGDETIPVKNAEGRAMVNQFIAVLMRNDPVYRYTREECALSTVQRTFSLGSEWVYFKFYCGAKSADHILQNGIAHIINEAGASSWIDHWFFIRYNDPDNHLRVRFHLTDTRFLPGLLRLIRFYILPFESNGVVWKTQADTYRRELERYGHETIQQIEHLFWVDSRIYLDFLDQTEGDEREEVKWLYGLLNIDRLLHAAGLSVSRKKMLIEKVRNAFAEEFKMDRRLKSQIDVRYRTCRKKLEKFLEEHHPLHRIFTPYEAGICTLWREISDRIADPAAFEQVLISCMHMTVNRLISSGQRLHELVMYDFLGRYYTSLIAVRKIPKVS